MKNKLSSLSQTQCEQIDRKKMATIAQNRLTYLALGDSYTVGEGITEEDNWPNQLVRSLRKLRLDFKDPQIVAKTGWTTDELDKAITLAGINRTFDMVSLSIGVNNQYRGRSVGNFRTEFRLLLERAIKMANNLPHNVLVISIPDWGLSPFAKDRNSLIIGKKIDAFNAVKAEECNILGSVFVDITEISRNLDQCDTVFAKDKLHYSGTMYGLWVEKIIETHFIT